MQETIVEFWDQKLMGKAGVDGNGQVNYEEAVKPEVAKVSSMRCLALVQCAEVLTAFKVSDHEEFFSVAELRHLMTNQDGRLT